MSATTSANGSYMQRAIDVTLFLAAGKFGTSGFNTVKLSGLRVIASIVKAGMPSMDRAQIRVYGVPPSIMNQVSTLGVPPMMARPLNAVLLEAGDAVNGMATVYTGYFQAAYQDFSTAPETFLNILGLTGIPLALVPTAPISFPGPFDVATAISSIATKAGWAFENSGVNVQLPGGYFAGSAMDQMQGIARAANAELYLDSAAAQGSAPVPGSGTVAIWPKTGIRYGAVPVISAATGMIGYPSFMAQGMRVKTLFNSTLAISGPKPRLGGSILVKSSAGNPAPQTVEGSQGIIAAGGAASGYWYVNALSHDISAQLPNGPWFSEMSCVRLPGQPP